MFAISHLALDCCHFFRCLVTYLTNNTFGFCVFFYYCCVLFQFCCPLCAFSTFFYLLVFLQFAVPLTSQGHRTLSALTLLSHFFEHGILFVFCFLILNISKGYSHLFLVSVVCLNSTFLQFKDCLIGFLSIFLALLKRLYNFPFYLSKSIVYILHGWVISHCGYFSVFLLTSRSVLKLLKGELLNVKSSLTLQRWSIRRHEEKAHESVSVALLFTEPSSQANVYHFIYWYISL